MPIRRLQAVFEFPWLVIGVLAAGAVVLWAMLVLWRNVQRASLRQGRVDRKGEYAWGAGSRQSSTGTPADEQLARGRYGVIETAAGRVVAVHLRPWPKLISWPEIWPVGAAYHARGQADRCLLYYNQPRQFSNFLALKYIVSARPARSYATCRAALAALDALAELKRTDALLCDAANTRHQRPPAGAASAGTPHKPQRWRRNFIKRFYGAYPPRATC